MMDTGTVLFLVLMGALALTVCGVIVREIKRWW